MPLTCISDFRSLSNWSFNDFFRKADLWWLYWTASTDNALYRVEGGRKLAIFQPGIPINRDGTASTHPYAVALRKLAEQYNARTNVRLYEGPDGGYLELLDLTARKFAPALALFLAHWHERMDGVGLDYWITPNNIVADFSFTPEKMEKWLVAQETLARVLRAVRPDILLVGQNDRMLGSTWGDLNGEYIEQSPYFNGRTLADHSHDLDQFSVMQNRINPGREMVSICEVREPWRWTPEALELVKTWATSEGLYLSLGRDAAARGA